MLSDVGGGGLGSALDVQSLFFFIKENWICAMTRHHVEPNINISLKKIFLLTLSSASEDIL